MQRWKKIAIAGAALVMPIAGIGAGIAGATAGIDPAPPTGSGGWYNAAGQPITTAQPGDTVSLTVTDVPPGSEDPNGTFALTYDTADLTLVSNGDTSATSVVTVNGGQTTDTFTYTDLAHSAKSDSFTFTVDAPAGVTATVQAVVTDTDDNTSATANFPLDIPAPAGATGAAGAQGPTGNAGANGANGSNGVSASNGSGGYWLVAADGGVFAYGGAQFYGSLPSLGIHVTDIVNIVPTADDKGYTLVAADGAAYAFGDAKYAGGMNGSPLNQPMVAGAAS